VPARADGGINPGAGVAAVVMLAVAVLVVSAAGYGAYLLVQKLSKDSEEKSKEPGPEKPPEEPQHPLREGSDR